MAAAAAEATERAQREAAEREQVAKRLANDQYPIQGISTIKFIKDAAIALASTANIWYDEKAHTLRTSNARDDNISREKFEGIATAAQNYGQKIMAGKGSTWHRFGDELLNVAALRWMEYKSDDRTIHFDNGSIADVSRRQFEDAAKDFNAAGALATGGKVSSVMRVKDDLVNLNALGHHWYENGRLRANQFSLDITPRQWQRVQVRQQRFDRAIDTALTTRTQLFAQFGSAQALATTPSCMPIVDSTSLLLASAALTTSMSTLTPSAPAFSSGGGGDFGGAGASGSFACDGGSVSCTP